MPNENPIPSILSQVAYRHGERQSGRPLRECTRDCYGIVHTDVVLALRLRTDPPISSGTCDARGLLLARELLDAEELGPAIIRGVEAIAVDGDALFVWAPTIKAWLTANPGFKPEDLYAQGLKIKYVRELH